MPKQFNVKFIDFFIDGLNYGNRLIIYSMQEFLKKNYNCNVETYDTRPVMNWDIGNFNDFDEEFLKTTPISSLDDIKNDNATTDLFMFPGDQIWNFGARPECFFRDFFTLPFIPRNKKAAYSVSDNAFFYHTSKDGRYIQDWCKKFLLDIGFISVREPEMQRFLRDNGIPSVCNIDGAFLTTQDEWREFEHQPKGFRKNQDFDLYYYVHTNKFEVHDGRKNAIVIGNVRGEERKFSLSEFVWLCSHCKTIYTNSFHGVCFGTMFNKRLVIDKRKRNIRIEQLFQLLGIRLSKYGNILNHEEVLETIQRERAKAKKYLDCVFQSIGNNMKRYALYSKSSMVRDLSSSGGFCGTLANHVLKNGGVVYGAAYIDNFRHVRTIKVDNVSDYFKLLAKSKYSFCQDCNFNEVKSDLESEKKVMFIGCPCQIRRLKEVLNKDYENLLLVDLFCYGYSEPKILEDFIDEVEQENVSKVVSLDMRKNHKHICSVKFMNGSEREYNNVFSKFINKENLMPMCKECNMHKGNNVSDITVGDFWDWNKEIHSPDFSPRNGTNIVALNTNVGESSFKEVSYQFNMMETGSVFNGIDNIDRKELESNETTVLNQSRDDFDLVVSFATYGKRIKKGQIYEFLDSIVNQRCNVKYKIVANLWKPDYDNAPQKLKDYFNEHGIEVALCTFNYKTFLKNLYVLENYGNKPIFTVDDDQVFRDDAIQLLWDTHLKYPTNRIGGFCIINGECKNGKFKKIPIDANTEPNFKIQTWGSGGVFYPPNFNKLVTKQKIDDWIVKSEWHTKYDNDHLLNMLGTTNNIPAMCVMCNHERQTKRGYLIEHTLPVSDDDTARTWMSIDKI